MATSRTTKATAKATAKKATATKATAKKATAQKGERTRARLSDDEVRAAIRREVKRDPKMATSWTRTLRHLRAEGIGGGGHIRFRELFVEVTGGKATPIKATPKKATAKKVVAARKATTSTKAGRRALAKKA